MYFESMKRGWNARLALLGLNGKKFCEMSGINYDSWKRLHNPTIEMCQKIEDAISKLEA